MKTFGGLNSLILWIFILSQTQTSACRSRKKTAEIEAAAPELTMTVLDLRNVDKKNTNFRYLLKDCGKGEKVSGVISDDETATDPVIKFKVTDLRAGDVCALDIKIDSLSAYPDKINFTDETLLMYSGRDAVVTQGLKGDYVAQINMRPNYFHDLPSIRSELQYTIKINVEFPEITNQSDRLSAFLYCDPEVKHLPSVYTASSETAGQFNFKSVVEQTGPQEHGCSKLTVYDVNTRKFFASMNDQKYRFAATAGQIIEFGTETLRMEKVVPPPSKIILETTPGKQCDSDTEVFDIVKKACVPKPSQ